ncbi:MAG: B12-binding domain-containing radical SAM protein [Planctomycetota bacterium]
MTPPIGPISLDYIAEAVQKAGFDVEVLDLALTDEPTKAMTDYFAAKSPELVGLTFRNVDDCFWPSADWFVPRLKDIVETLHGLTEAPIVVGGVGFSIFGRTIVEHTGADFGIRGDGELAVLSLMEQLRLGRAFDKVPGLVWRSDGAIYCNPPAWPDQLSIPPGRRFVDNLAYFKRGGQCGLETKRGCNRKCVYCADYLAKGSKLRPRPAAEVADEAQALLDQGVDVLHVCDSEFNIPASHAHAVCDQLNRRSLGKRLRWYTYMSPVPFDAELAEVMARAGCVGIDFTGDSACPSMLTKYCQKHSREDIALAVNLCGQNNIAVMIDLLLGGPGETPQTVAETIDFMKKIGPDCVGAALGVRVYPGTAMEKMVGDRLNGGTHQGIRRKYDGPVDLLKPTFYISPALGERPAELVKDLIAGDKRFFEPAQETQVISGGSKEGDYNYNENLRLRDAIQKGARGAYWHILRKLRR